MKFIEAKNYSELSLTACGIMENIIAKKPNAVIALATGGSPAGTYKAFAESVKSKGTDLSCVRFIKLDEWLGLPRNHISTCETYLEEYILSPLNINRENYIAFNSEAVNVAEECERVGEWLLQNGSIDLCVLGLGVNGHLGLNEPSEYLLPFCHTVAIAEDTSKHQMLTQANITVTGGITLGMADILSSGEILFLVAGSEKSKAFNRFMSSEITTECPSTALWLHRNVTCVINKADF